MTDLTFQPDGDGGLWCSVCGINAGFTITDPVAHADWHDDTASDWLSGVTQAITEWRAWRIPLTPTEERGALKVQAEQQRRYVMGQT